MEIDLQFLKKERDKDSENEEVMDKIKLDAIDPITLALQGTTEFDGYYSLEYFSNYL